MNKLRPLDFQPVFYQGQQMWLLNDPLKLSDAQLIVPPALAQLFILLDGTRDVEALHADFCRLVGESVDYDIVAGTLAQLDAACLLENERSAEARRAQLRQYRALPFRPPTLADVCYPADPVRLRRALNGYGDGRQNGRSPWRGRGVISPHIDYQRGGPVYARVWQEAATAAAEAELILIFGTDHNGGSGTVTLTRQRYATPHGPIPADLALVDAVAEAIGPENAYAEELHHRDEHSVELSAVWVDHARREQSAAPCPMLPVLCGSFQPFVEDGRHPSGDPILTATIDALQRATAGRRVLAVASVDFAHVGPTFGDGFVMDEARRAALRRSDGRLFSAIESGDADRFYEEIAAVGDRNRICGFSSIYLLLRYLGETGGTAVAYEHCPADAEDHSLVSIGGLLLD